ncbi:MAG: type II secretion system protein, partial [Phycisphaerae bacterium]|nr:type II secretion system protein [Phycisphaerae bacterium]
MEYKNGFTLVEVLIAVMLLGIAIAAIVGSNSAFTQATAQAGQLSTAEFLSEQIRELTAMVSDIDGLEALDGAVYDPVIDSRGRELTGFDGYSQMVTVENVSVNNFEQA